MFLWLQTEPERLGTQLEVVQDERNRLLLSAASSWEIAITYALGRLPLPEPPATYVPRRMRAIGADALDVEHGHALAVAELPMHHGDLFDRLLVAQARAVGAPILTADPALAACGAETLIVDR